MLDGSFCRVSVNTQVGQTFSLPDSAPQNAEDRVMGRHSTTITAVAIAPPAVPPRKRKRDQSPAAEIEVDVTAPEPPSKKALRRAKKGKATSVPAKAEIPAIDVATTTTEPASDENSKSLTTQSKRSVYGIWIGNLPWTATKLDIRNFLTKDTDITEEMVTRLHMPPPNKSAIAASRQIIKPQNQGFAYVDFSSESALTEALALSEKLLTGRRVLIKDSKSFEGRPEKPKENGAAVVQPGKPLSKRIFVGNLGFNTTQETLQDHFACCGEILDVHVATFEDTGKCKGYAWIEFSELKAAEAAVKGWVHFEDKDSLGNEDEEIAEALADQPKPNIKHKPRKWWVNKLGGRLLRMEFAEAKDVRYKKRYGKDGSVRKGDVVADPVPESEPTAQPVNEVIDRKAENAQRRIDARTIQPGAALSAAPRASSSIVASQGRKITFE